MRRWRKIMITNLGYLAGFLTTFALVPQVAKTWKTKSANDLSLGMLWVFNLGVICWLTYGILIGNKPLIFWNTITMFMALLILIMKIKYE
jgi:MtN3 and saliva related transmembrane protein